LNGVKLVWVTPAAEENVTYCARVSSPENQENFGTAAKLLQYCIKKKHWSIFTMANMCVEINTTRAISAQFIRHSSIHVQEFSTRYQNAGVLGSAQVPHLRRQDVTNRQNSIDDLDAEMISRYYRRISSLFEETEHLYQEMISNGVAKECARGILPLTTPTRLEANATLRSWITYIALREKNGTQEEHRDLAKAIKLIFCEQFPTIAEALGGSKEWEI
jgi:thymidylate synthase (FAD)